MWTYQAGAVPANLGRDTVRLMVGDTRAEDPLLQDEEVAMAMALHAEPRLAAAVLCESLAAQYARLVDVSVGSKRVSLSALSQRFAERAKVLRDNEEAATGTGSGAVVAAGYLAGQSWAELELDWSDPDRVLPPFGVVGDTSPPPFLVDQEEQTLP